MTLDELSAREAVQCVGALVRQLLLHPGMTSQDKAAIVLAGADLAEIEKRHLGRFTPFDPATLPRGVQIHAFAPVAGLPKGWLVDHENRDGVAS